jgi:hypothetical protein
MPFLFNHRVVVRSRIRHIVGSRKRRLCPRIVLMTRLGFTKLAALNSVLNQYVGCNECMAEITLREAFDREDASWPNQSWISFTCKTCGCSNPLIVENSCVTEGYLDGFPAPCFVPKRHISVPGLFVKCETNGIQLRNLNLSWCIPLRR